MSCTGKSYLALSIPAQPSESRKRSTFTMAIAVVIEAFQEALDLRREAQKTFLLYDE
jgi:hypothetical protein